MGDHQVQIVIQYGEYTRYRPFSSERHNDRFDHNIAVAVLFEDGIQDGRMEYRKRLIWHIPFDRRCDGGCGIHRGGIHRRNREGPVSGVGAHRLFFHIQFQRRERERPESVGIRDGDHGDEHPRGEHHQDRLSGDGMEHETGWQWHRHQTRSSEHHRGRDKRLFHLGGECQPVSEMGNDRIQDNVQHREHSRYLSPSSE